MGLLQVADSIVHGATDVSSGGGGSLANVLHIVARHAQVNLDPPSTGICCLDGCKHHGALFHASAIFAHDAVTNEGATRSYTGRHFCSRCGNIGSR